MTAALRIRSVGPGVTVQDAGRPGYLAQGVSRGGAVDRLALQEGAALMGWDRPRACLEMAGMGGQFEATAPVRIALTGAPMRADIDGQAVAWNAVHRLPEGSRLTIGGARAGVYGYLHVAGGLDTGRCLGGQGTHVAAAIGRPVAAGDSLALAADPAEDRVGLCLDVADRFSGGDVRVVPSLHSALFPEDEIARLQDTAFARDARGNRMGVRMASEGDGFGTADGLSILSEVIAPGDIQIVGDGAPFVLLADCQTTGGYPRIGSVLPCDLPRVAQAPPGAEIRFRMVTLDEGTTIERAAAETWRSVSRTIRPLVLRPEDLRNLLGAQLISGVTAGHDADLEEM